MTIAFPLDAEWLESDAMGGFASGTLAGYRTRRYHAPLLTARRPPTDRVVLVNGFEAWVDAAGSSFPLSTQHYAPDVIHQRGTDHMVDAIVETVERELLTPLGLRTLAPGDAAYRTRYEGGVRDRDAAYHQGTVWPWLIGPFVDAWLSVNGDDQAHRDEARSRFLAPLQAHLGVAGLGHVSEIADGDLPHTLRGCPFQAWSTGELIRAIARTERRAPAADKTRTP